MNTRLILMFVIFTTSCSHQSNNSQHSTSCNAPQQWCGTACVDLQSSSSHCGQCGVVCTGNFVCTNGACIDPCLSCTNDQICVQGQCLPKVCSQTKDCSLVLDYICKYDPHQFAKVCTPKQAGDCKDETECPKNHVCDGGQCYPNCYRGVVCKGANSCDPVTQRCICNKKVCEGQALYGCRPDTNLCDQICDTSPNRVGCLQGKQCLPPVVNSRIGFCYP